MSNLRVQLTSWPDLDNLIAEIWRGDQYVADVKIDGGSFLVTFRSSENAAPVQVDLDDLKSALDEACRSLQQ